jgi:cytochrome b561
MIVTNMSLGILLATVLVVRIVWRLMPGHGVASKTVHFLLYILLVAQATSGFVLRWSGNEAMSFFGVLIPPTVAPFSKPAHEIVYVR